MRKNYNCIDNKGMKCLITSKTPKHYIIEYPSGELRYEFKEVINK